MNPVTTLIDLRTQDHPETALFVTGMLTGSTCSETEVLAEILRVLGERDLATDMLACHALADEPGDQHHAVLLNPRPTLQDVAVALEHLTMASSRHDATAYRAALRDAARVGLNDEQIEDSWYWGWSHRRADGERPTFDHHGNITA